MYFLTSSALIPIPLSVIVIVLFFLSIEISIFVSPISPLNSPIEANFFSLVVASTALETNSLKNIS